MSRPSDIFVTGEIVHEVVQAIDSVKTLARCARVCRLWHSEAIPKLWKGSHFSNSHWRSPDLRYLVELAKSPESFRYYVQFIDKLTLTNEYGDPRRPRSMPIFTPELWSTFKGSEVLVDYRSTPDFNVNVLIHPGLKSLFLCKCTCSKELLDFVRNTCISLEFLKISLKHESPVSESLQAFKQSPLKYLEITDHNNNADGRVQKQYTIDLVALHELLKSPSLQYLALPVNYGDLTMIQLDNFTSNLRCIKLGIYVQQCGNIFQFLPNLESFSMNTQGPRIDLDTEIFQPIIACPKLRELEVLSTYATFGPGALTRFARGCPMVHTIHLHIFTLMNSLNIEYQIHASEVSQAAELWPQLYYLGLRIPVGPLDAADLIRIGRSCPRLTHMAIGGELKISVLLDEAILYSQLEYFHLKLISVEVQDDPRNSTESDLLKEPLKYINRCMPQLKLVENTFFKFRHQQGRIRRICENQHRRHIVPSDETYYKGPSVRRDIELGLSQPEP